MHTNDMNNMRTIRIMSGALCIIVGLLVYQVHADQEFIHLAPSEGSEFLVSLKSNTVFEQEFKSNGQNISALGPFLIPVQPSAKTSNGLIHVELLQGSNVVSSGDIPVSRVDGDGASLIRLNSPVQSVRGEFLTMRITASSDASGLVALQKRMFDESFPDRDIAFMINGTKQNYPVAYSVFERVWPNFVRQFGGLLTMAGLLLLSWNLVLRNKTGATLATLAGIAALYAIPSFGEYGIFFPAVLALIIASWAVLRIAGRTSLASIFGACIFACSTWLPLFLVTSGSAGALLPIRDALIDPNQISVSHGAGGYVGIPGALFAVIGLVIWVTMLIQKRFTAAHGETSMAAIFLLGMIVTFMPGQFHYSRAIIVVVACIAWFASLTFDKLQRFLGARDIFIQVLLGIFICIALLDLMHITSRTLAYGLGI